jgi:protocatechuate 3,4-dioxygenase beta subunit
MTNKRQSRLTRRKFLGVSLAVPPALALTACSVSASDTEAPAVTTAPQPTRAPPTATALGPTPPPTQPTPTQTAQVLPPTPACGDDDDPTLAQTEGPYFTPNSPERASLLESGMTGTKLILTGYVLSTDCRPIAGALLDFWQADNAGQYDNAGYRLRGHQFADDAGRYTLETIVPGLYPGRTRHIHVKVQAPNQPILTSQLYFPGESSNDTDSIFNPKLLVDMQDVVDGKEATFNFVLNVG